MPCHEPSLGLEQGRKPKLVVDTSRLGPSRLRRSSSAGRTSFAGVTGIAGVSARSCRASRRTLLRAGGEAPKLAVGTSRLRRSSNTRRTSFRRGHGDRACQREAAELCHERSAYDGRCLEQGRRTQAGGRRVAAPGNTDRMSSTGIAGLSAKLPSVTTDAATMDASLRVDWRAS